MVTRRDYTAEKVEAARSVLIELVHLLGEYREDMVLIGGWVPPLLLANADVFHTGSMDVDVALNHLRLKDEGYRTIRRLLLEKGYRQGEQPFIFYRQFSADLTVQVDLLAGEYEGTGRNRRHQKVQDLLARKVRGCDLAFEEPARMIIEGELPGGGRDSVTVRVAAIVPFLVMKGMALDDRLKEKDAWDIYYCVRYYDGGLPALIQGFQSLLQHGLVREGLMKIAKHFASEKHFGPKAVADFEEVLNEEDRALLQRDAYERVQFLLRELGICS